MRVDGQRKKEFKVKNGLRQSDPFNLALEYVVRQARLNKTGHQHLTFADDKVIMTRSIEELREKIIVRNIVAQRMDLKTNEQNTKKAN